MILSSCSATPHRRAILSDSGLLVLGVTAKNGLDSLSGRDRYAAVLAEQLTLTERYKVVSATELRHFIGDNRHNTLLERIGRTGYLASEDLHTLEKARVPAALALVLRVEADESVQLPEMRSDHLNRQGARNAEWQNRNVATQRRTLVSAQVVRLRDGRALWSRFYKAEPVNEIVHEEYHGTSLATRALASVANLLANGIQWSRYPDPPALSLSMEALMRRIARDLPAF